MAEITKINALQLLIDKTVEGLHSVDLMKKIIWFGLTDFIDIIHEALAEKQLRIHCIIDNDAEKWGVTYERNLIVLPVNQAVKNHTNDAVYLLSSRFKEEMKQQLIGLGIVESDIILLPCHAECESWARNSLLEQLKGLQSIGLMEMQLVMLDILKVFRDFCKQNGLRYFLAGGTLIGAVRHKGFIPWDDDADVYLPDSDYNKFLTLFPKGGRYEIINWERNTDFILDFAQLVDNNTVMLHPGYPVEWLQGVKICVIPLRGYPERKDLLEASIRTNEVFDERWYCYQYAKDIVSGLLDLRHDIFDFKYSMPFLGSPLVGKSHLMTKPMWTVPSWVFAETVPIEFEGEMFSAPIGYDYYLKQRFGDYMRLPQEDEKQNHGFIPFWKGSKHET